MAEQEDIVSKTISNQLKQEVAQQTNDIYDSLVGSKNNSKLPEDIFVNYFLPHFSGQQSATNNPKVFTDWISVAGTPSNEVDIIDDAGTTLYSVPSLFDTSIIDTVKRDVGNSLADIYSQYDLRSNNIPIVANNFLNKELSKKLSIVDINADHSQITDRWNKIFTRYGLEAIAASTSVPVKEDAADDLIYD